jgi:hypothetical protein
MELIILGGIALVALLFNVAGMAFVFGRGGPVWDRRAQTEAKWLFGAILVAGVAIGAVWFGVAALLSIWPFWLALGVAARRMLWTVTRLALIVGPPGSPVCGGCPPRPRW